MTKHTNESIDFKILNLNIKRLENYISLDKKIKWQCLKDCCKYEWVSIPGNVLSGKSGCPKCNKRVVLNNDNVDAVLKEKNILIERVENVYNARTNIKWKCLKIQCNYIWKATPSNIINKYTGCPNCNSAKPLSNEIIDLKLQNRPIKRLSEYTKSSNKMQWLCLNKDCNNKWWTTSNKILNQKTGCASCQLKPRAITNEKIDLKIKDKNIKRLDSYFNSKQKISWKCLVCDYIWKTKYCHIKNGSGCPVCNKRKNEMQVFSFLKDNNFKFEHNFYLYKINNIENKRWNCDFYLSELNIIIEYNGPQHYKSTTCWVKDKQEAEKIFKKQQNRDKKVEQFCTENNILLITIDGRKYYNEKLVNYLNNNVLSILMEFK